MKMFEMESSLASEIMVDQVYLLIMNLNEFALFACCIAGT